MIETDKNATPPTVNSGVQAEDCGDELMKWWRHEVNLGQETWLDFYFLNVTCLIPCLTTLCAHHVVPTLSWAFTEGPQKGRHFFSVRMEMWGNIKGKRKLLAWYPTCFSWVEVVRRFIKNCLLQDGFWGKSVTHETFSVKESSEHIWEASTCQDLCIISCSVDISIAIL